MSKGYIGPGGQGFTYPSVHLATDTQTERERCAKVAHDYLMSCSEFTLADRVRDIIIHGDEYFSDPDMPPLK